MINEGVSCLEPIRKETLTYSLDTLTDGSEYTGNGTVFLTVRRRPPNAGGSVASEDLEICNDTLLARYALTGLGTLTARLAADQCFKLSPVRALFCPSRMDVSCTCGIPSLLLALSQNSLTGRLNVIGPEGIDDYMDKMTDIILGKGRAYPKVATCVVPPLSLSSCWWKVYDDEYILVHARECKDYGKQGAAGNGNNISCASPVVGYIVTLKQFRKQSTEETRMVSNDATFSFAVLPPHIDGSCSSNILSQLPEVVVEKHMDERKRALEFIMHVNPKNTISRLEVERKDSVRRRIQINQDMAKMAKYHLATLPDEVGVTWDRGILIRASHQSNILSSHLSFAFPSHGISQQSSNRRKCLSDESSKKGCCFVECRKLRSCTTIILRNIEENDIEQDDVGQFLEIDREKRVWEKVEKKCGGIDHIRNKRRKTMNELKQLYSNGKINLITRTTDDNEICLSDESGEEESNDAQDHDAYEIELPDESNEVEESILVQDITGEKGFMLPEVDENEVILSEDSDSNCDRGMPEDAQHGRKRKRRTDSRHSYSESRIRKTSSSEVSETEGSGLNNLIPHLLVLGTGCASPSPFRGSSAYCLLLPTLIKVENGNKQVSLAPNLTLSAILECGEGCLNGMHRHLVSTKNFCNRSMDCLSEVRFIWISHSHLDHYGELPLVIAEIQKRTLNIRQCTCYDRSNFRRKEANISQKELRGPKCQRCGHLLPPLIIAPAKVLQFLDLSLGCKNGMSKDCGRLFFSTSSRDFNNSPFAQQLRDDVFQYELFRQPNENPSIYDEIDESKMAKYRPFRFIRHIPAWHCYDAHAILLGLCTDGVGNEGRRSESFQPSPSPLFFLCYSGDTRPSSQLVQACKEATRNYSQGISLLVHEATFDDDERGRKEALSKKHSTVTEALAIAKETDSLACLLTHFSQRYARLPPGYKKGDTYCDLNMKCKSSIGTAVDGMILPLHDSVTSTILPLLTTCTNDILSELENNDYLNRIN